MPHADTAPAAGRQRSDTTIVLTLALAAMVVSMMQTLVVPILGLIQNSLGTTTANVSWVTTATLLSAAVFTPLLGRFGDQHGKKRTLVGVLVVMVIGSLVAATTHSLLWLLVGRVLQGSATAIFPLALSVLREEIRPQKLPGAMALVSGTLAFGSGLALVATGLLTQGDNADYRTVFWFALGLAAAALLAVIFLVPADRNRIGGRTDVLGALTLGAFLVLLLLPISQGHEWGWSSAPTIGTFAGAAVMAAVWAFTESRVREPMVDLKMFAHRPVLFTNVAGLLVGFAMFAQFIGVSYLVQMPDRLTGYGFSASVLRASVEYLLPSTMVSLVAAPVGGILVKRFGARVVLAIGAVIGTGGFAWLTTSHDSTASVIGAGMVIGASISFGYAAMPALIVASVPHHQTGIANGINSISRSVGSSIGSAMITTLLASKTIEGLPHGVPPLPAESQFNLSFDIAGAAFVLVLIVALFGLTKAHAPRMHRVAGDEAGNVGKETESATTAEGTTTAEGAAVATAADRVPQTAEAIG
ncbi:MFS transporter [Wenjunlia tyrosinilytica]|uniref:MFS transporter n=1 Tax=Wenjunlia tyrosinilytica TaxID=1544741 RepID=A0A917ZHU6_9ACTN|nr:MFS transporter [Wenjunlia tyrosinilytica]GGO82777.1 MFS transporter [Wenjunlia tyrosinilytica]